jgi:hypothetical protein
MQPLIYFLLQRAAGVSKPEAVRSFVASRLCRSLGLGLTVEDVWSFAEFAYGGEDQ